MAFIVLNKKQSVNRDKIGDTAVPLVRRNFEEPVADSWPLFSSFVVARTPCTLHKQLAT